MCYNSEYFNITNNDIICIEVKIKNITNSFIKKLVR